MQAGTLRHRITLQTATESRGADYGDVTQTWADTATVWARVEPLSGREFFNAHLVQAELTHRITIRHRTGVNPKMRVSWDSRLFDIESVLDIDERGRELHLMCKELVDP